MDDPVGLTYRRNAIKSLLSQGYRPSYAKGTTKIYFFNQFDWEPIPFTDTLEFQVIFDALSEWERGSLAEDAYIRWKKYYASIHNATLDFGENDGFGQFGFNSAPFGEIKYSNAGYYDVSNYQLHAANGNLVLIRPNKGFLEAARVTRKLPPPRGRKRRFVNL